MLYLAIDQHSKQLTVNLRDEQGQILVRRQVSTWGAAPTEFLRDVDANALGELHDGPYLEGGPQKLRRYREFDASARGAAEAARPREVAPPARPSMHKTDQCTGRSWRFGPVRKTKALTSGGRPAWLRPARRPADRLRPAYCRGRSWPACWR